MTVAGVEDASWPRVLKPFDISDAISTGQAARIAGRSHDTIRRWVAVHHIGRRIAGQWRVSRVALQMFLDDDRAALVAYLDGDRAGGLVAPYFRKPAWKEKAANTALAAEC